MNQTVMWPDMYVPVTNRTTEMVKFNDSAGVLKVIKSFVSRVQPDDKDDFMVWLRDNRRNTIRLVGSDRLWSLSYWNEDRCPVELRYVEDSVGLNEKAHWEVYVWLEAAV